LQEQSTKNSDPRRQGTFSSPEPKQAQALGTRGIVFDVQRFAIHDGPGVRTLVFMKGCPLRCWWCQNPEGLFASKSLGYFEYRCIRAEKCVGSCPSHALSFEDDGLVVDRAACDACGICVEGCPTGALSMVGREIDVDELMREIEKDILLYDNSGGGVTFSGGEPLFQPAFLRESLMECRRRGIHTTLETSGYAPPKVFESIIDYVDLFLFDLKLLDDGEHRKYTGVSNAVIKKNMLTLVERNRGRDVVVRHPVIPGINDTEESTEELLGFIHGLDGVSEVDLLPYHDVFEKYKRLGLKYNMRVHVAPSEEKLSHIKERLEKAGLKVRVRG
jgi:pyruvate formate lyase activating enzyme